MNPAKTLLTGLTLCLSILAFAHAQAPQTSRPPLAPCEEAAEMAACVEAVTDISQIVGMWRRYFEGANSMAYTAYREDGTFTIAHSPHGEPHVTGRIAFDGELAAISANPDGPAPPPCVAPGRYELRLIRLGEQPIALSHVLVGEDGCVMRAGDLSRPMVYYEGGGDDLEPNPDMAALEQPLVPCEGEAARPCDLLAAQPSDIVGVWKQFLGNPMLAAPDGMGYIRYHPDGSYSLADTPENTAAPYANYPRGSYSLTDGVITIAVEMMPPECRSAQHTLRVYRYSDQPVALHYTPLEDACPGRLSDLSRPLIWVAPATE